MASLVLLLGCISPPPPPSYHFFAPADPQRDPWYEKVEEWQARAHEQAETPPVRRVAATGERRLENRVTTFAAHERIELARKISLWARLEARKFYQNDSDQSLEGDHWPTYAELAERNGDDCDGLDLVAYQLLIEFGFPRDQLFRAVMRRDRDRRNHMVTLWFENPEDPWVFDATGALTRKLVRFSATTGWTPTAVFNERHQFSVAASGSADKKHAHR